MDTELKQDLHITAHQFCKHNQKALAASQLCGCFYCCKIYLPMQIKEWCDKSNQTAICPYCHIDSVIASLDCELSIDLLEKMQSHWFTVARFDKTPEPVKQVIVMRTDLNMRKGKMIAQGGHAVCSFLVKKIKAKTTELSPAEESWVEGTFTKICVGVNSEEELLAVYQKAKEEEVEVSLITDSGRTEFNGIPTNTCLAIGPDFVSRIDPITSHLKLL